MIVATAVGRVLDHFARAELTLPPDQLPWRSGPVVRGLRLLPVRYQLRTGALPAQRPEPAGPSTAPTADGYARRLLTVLRRLMPGGKEEDRILP